MKLIDSHCHLHFSNYDHDRDTVISNSVKAGVSRIINVGTDFQDSKKAIELAASKKGMWATVGVHPNNADEIVDLKNAHEKLAGLLSKKKVIAVGEIGLDYYHNRASKKLQEKALRLQLDAGLQANLPFVFHIREAFSGFWPILDSYKSSNKIRGVVHSFSASPEVLDEALTRGLSVGFNGLLTYTKDASWLDSAKNVPLSSILLETDAPFLTPVPERGKRCEPKHTLSTAKFLAKLRGEELKDLVEATTSNTIELFQLDQTEVIS